MANNEDKNTEESSIIPTEQMLPGKLMLIPLQGRPIFPGIFSPLMINSEEDIKAVEKAYESDGFIGIVMLKNDAEHPQVSDLYKVGTVVRIIRKVVLPDGGLNVFISTNGALFTISQFPSLNNANG